MILDVRTELSILSLDALIFSISLFAVRSRKMRDGQQAWGIALLLMAAGWAMLACPPDEAPQWIYSLGAFLLSACCSAYAFSMYGFARLRAPRLLLLLIPVALLGHEFANLGRFTTQAIVSNATIGLQLALVAWPLLREARDLPTQLRVATSACFALPALATLSRSLELLLAPAMLTDLRISDPLNTGAFLVNHACLVFGNLGIALMHRERTRAEADRLSTRDPLTELMNRRSITRLVERELLHQQRNGGVLALLMIAIDDFRDINNRFGQLAGDRVLRQFSRLLTSTLRGQDLGGRYSSTEFCVLLPETGQAGARSLADRLRQTVAAAEIGPDGIRYTISQGIAESRPGETNAALLLAQADDALRLARHRGPDSLAAGGGG